MSLGNDAAGGGTLLGFTWAQPPLPGEGAGLRGGQAGREGPPSARSDVSDLRASAGIFGIVWSILNKKPWATLSSNPQ